MTRAELAATVRRMQFFGFHLMPWPYMSKELVEQRRLELGHRLERELRPGEGARALRPLPRRARRVRARRVRRHLRQRAPPDRLRQHPLAERDGGAARAANDAARSRILGNAISLRDHPLRVAEEIALLDVVSGGRIISGFVRGIGAEYHAFSLDPTQSRDRFYEAHDLIIKAWTEPGPFEWYGKHFKLRYVNPWPRPAPAAAPADLEPVARQRTRRSTGRRRTTTPTSRPTPT